MAAPHARGLASGRPGPEQSSTRHRFHSASVRRAPNDAPPTISVVFLMHVTLGTPGARPSRTDDGVSTGERMRGHRVTSGDIFLTGTSRRPSAETLRRHPPQDSAIDASAPRFGAQYPHTAPKHTRSRFKSLLLLRAWTQNLAPRVTERPREG